MSPRPPVALVVKLALLAGLPAFAVGLRAAPVRAAPGESTILAWNAAALEAIRAESTPPPLAARNLAILHLALDDAAHDPAGGIEVQTAITGCAVTSAMFPGRRGDLERVREQILSSLSPAPTPQAWTRAQQRATFYLEARADDGASRSVTYIPHANPGDWRRTSPFFRPPELPQWPDVRTFAIPDPKALVPSGPPALDSAAWAAALDASRRLGAKASTERTADQTMTARFWSDFSYTTTPPGHWNEIAAAVARTRGFDEPTTARLFAALNVAMADTGIVCWETKYRYNFWRPITALEHEGWQSLLTTPPHPEFPSGHSAFSGAAAAVLEAFVGSDECEFSVRSDALPGVERHFRRFSDAAREISMSRVYGGIHFQFSCDAGLQIGRTVAQAVLRLQSTPQNIAPRHQLAAQ